MFTQQKIRVICFYIMTVVLAVVLVGMVGFPSFAQKSVIRFLTDENDPKTMKAYSGMEQRFEKMYPQYDLQIEYISFSDWWPKLMASLQAKTPPEIAYLDPDYVVDIAKKGYLYDLRGLLEAVGKGGASDFYQNVIKLVYQKGKGAKKGAIWGVPANLGIMFMMYRKDLFKEAGLSVPQTWDEYLNSLAKVTEGKKVRGINLFMGQIHAEQQLLATIWSNGGYMFGKPNGVCVLDSPENIEAVKFLQKLWKYASPGAVSDNYTDAFMRFVNGGLATCWAYGRTLASIDRYNPKMADDVGAAFIPKPLAGVHRSTLFPEFLVVFKDAHEIEGAKKFIKFHMRPEENIRILASVPGHMVPSRKSVAHSEMLYSDPMMKRYRYAIELQTRYIPYGRNIGFEHGQVCYKSTRLTKSPILVDLMYDALAKGMSAEEALRKAAQRTNELFKK